MVPADGIDLRFTSRAARAGTAATLPYATFPCAPRGVRKPSQRRLCLALLAACAQAAPAPRRRPARRRHAPCVRCVPMRARSRRRRQRSRRQASTTSPAGATTISAQAWGAFRASCRGLRFREHWRAACERANGMEAPDAAAVRAYFETNFVPYRVVNPDGAHAGPGHRLLRAAAARQPRAARAIPASALRAARRSARHRSRGGRARDEEPAAARAPRRAPRGALLLARRDRERRRAGRGQGDRVRRRRDRGLLPADPGLGPRAARHGRGVAHRLCRPERPPVSVDRPLPRRERRAASSARRACRGSRRGRARIPRASCELLNQNPSYVFFRELPPSDTGPIGALGVPLTAERSIAVDPRFVPLGAPVYLSTTRPNRTRRSSA